MKASITRPFACLEGTREKNSDNLWPWLAATGVYLLIIFVIILCRRDEIGSLVQAAKSSDERLKLNDLGDVAAGIFAPLAFLWFFVATLLQRKELRLQREEIAETRTVLADQKRELEKSATESADQTEIMRKTLDATNSRNIYEEFNIKLYYLARIWHGLSKHQIYVRRLDNTTDKRGFLAFDDTTIPKLDDSTSVDAFFDRFHLEIKFLTEYKDATFVTVGVNPEFNENMQAGLNALRELIDISNNTDNSFIKIRIK